MTDQRTMRTDMLPGLPDPAHAPGKTSLGPPPKGRRPRPARVAGLRHQPWLPTSGLIGRQRRSARRG